MTEKISTPNAPAAIGPYSQAVRYGNILFTSGQIALDPVSGNLTGESTAAQTEQVMKNLAAILEAVGSSFAQVIKTTCFLADIADFADFNAVYSRYFNGSNIPSAPARSCVAVKALPKGALVEVEVIAAIG